MENPLYLVASHDYADEFDVDCAMVMPHRKYDTMLATIREAFDKELLDDDAEFYFGTNECLRFQDFSAFEDGLTAQACSQEFAAEFLQLNKGSSVGYNVFEALYERAKQLLRDD